MVSSVYFRVLCFLVFFFSSRRRHTRYWRDWSSDVCSSDLFYREDERFLMCSTFKLVLTAAILQKVDAGGESLTRLVRYRSEERRVGKEGRSRWSPYH